MEVAKDLDLLACLIETITSCGIECSWILVKRNFGAHKRLHLTGATYELSDVEACDSDREEADRS